MWEVGHVRQWHCLTSTVIQSFWSPHRWITMHQNKLSSPGLPLYISVWMLNYAVIVFQQTVRKDTQGEIQEGINGIPTDTGAKWLSFLSKEGHAFTYGKIRSLLSDKSFLSWTKNQDLWVHSLSYGAIFCYLLMWKTKKYRKQQSMGDKCHVAV